MTLVLSQYLDSDYDPIPFTDHIWLPKDFNDRKHLIAYVRKCTRKGIRITKDGTLSLEEIYKGDIKPKNIKKSLDFSDLKGKVRPNFKKFLNASQGSLASKPKKVELVTETDATLNKMAIKSRKSIFKLNHYAWLFQQAQLKHEFNGEFPSSCSKSFKLEIDK